MKIRKAFLLFSILLLLSITLLFTSGIEKGSAPCNGKDRIRCCKENPVKPGNITPWKLLTESMLHIPTA